MIFQARKALKTEKEAHEFAIDNLTEDNGELHALVSELQGKKEGLEAEAAESAAQRSAFKAQLDALEAKRKEEEEAKAGRVDTASPSRSDALLQVHTLFGRWEPTSYINSIDQSICPVWREKVHLSLLPREIGERGTSFAPK